MGRYLWLRRRDAVRGQGHRLVPALVIAYRKQRIAKSAEKREAAKAAVERTRVFNERFITAAQQLGVENAAVRLAGVYAMAGLADDWEEQRQTCIDVLCAYLRIPYLLEPRETNAAELASWRGLREVRHTIIRVITVHLRNTARVSWQGYNLDFSAVVFDGGDFSSAQFTGGNVDFASVGDWSVPPEFPRAVTDAPPEGVFLPPVTPIVSTP